MAFPFILIVTPIVILTRTATIIVIVHYILNEDFSTALSLFCFAGFTDYLDGAIGTSTPLVFAV